MLTVNKLHCDLCVIGGGIAGMCTAISAARMGIKTVLMQERPVLGGNASSEIRMWISGSHGSNNRETGIIEEIALENMYRNPTKSFAVWDSILYSFVRREKNIELLLNCTCIDAETETGEFPHGRDIRIRSVTGYQMTTQMKYEVCAGFYADCSGDSILAPLTGAWFRCGREAAVEFDEITTTTAADKKTMGMSCLIQGRETEKPIRFRAPEWSTHLTGKDFENREPDIYNDDENFWYLELGGNRDSIADTEKVRDELLSLAVGTWDYVKNSGSFRSENWDLEFLGFLPGKRESRRMVGEYILTQKDISSGRVFEDEVAFGGWPLDDHYPDGFFHPGVPNTDYHTPAPYSIPYRSLYSKNVDNLFFAGRNISTSHMALSSTRVMATCALLGEAAGRAAALCVKYHCSPHDITEDHLSELQESLMAGDCFLPSKTRHISGICASAVLEGAADVIRNGQDRPHRIYGTTEETAAACVQPGSSILYRFPAQEIQNIHIVFSSDLDRNSLTGSNTERTRSTRANYRLDHPQQPMPACLCREFILTGTRDGKEKEIMHVSDNHKRCYDISLKEVFDSLRLTAVSSWGGAEVPVISFDFR